MDARVDLVYVEAGGGHKAAATALGEVIRSEQRPWNVRLFNFTQELGSLDVVKKLTGQGVEDIYNILLKNGWTLGTKQMMQGMHLLIWLYENKQVGMLRDKWSANTPDMVVSLIPHFNRALKKGIELANPNAPFVTIITDFADIPPRVWLERQQQYVICGTDKAVEQAFSFGHPKDRVFRVSGMIMRPAFYEVPPIDRAAERQKVGLSPDLPTGVVLFGGEGSKAMVDVARRLGESGLKLQLILMHGRNQKLGARLRELKLSLPVHVQGFTSEVPKFMQMADFMIGKPGPGSISEALAMKLPIIVDLNAWTMPQERYNAAWLEEKRLGIVVNNWGGIVPAVSRLLAPGELDAYRERAGLVNNRAVFEITDILAEILRRGR